MSLQNHPNPEKFKNKYRVPSARLSAWDYSADGYYFVTICTANREHFFGEIRNSEMVLNDIGQIVECEWQNTVKIRKNIKLDEFVIMPNHLHGIVVIDNLIVDAGVETHCNASLPCNALPRSPISPQPPQPPQPHQQNQPYKNKFGPQSNNLSAVIRGFKGTITKKIHEFGFENFEWQPRFHDHIIRDEDELNRIRGYIQNNPTNWKTDENNQSYK